MARLIKCDYHNDAPVCFVCTHIRVGSTQECVRIPTSQTGDALQDDWLCIGCFEKRQYGVGVNDLLTICIHCARILVKDMKQPIAPEAAVKFFGA